jgi:hypothetical protein
MIMSFNIPFFWCQRAKCGLAPCPLARPFGPAIIAPCRERAVTRFIKSLPYTTNGRRLQVWVTPGAGVQRDVQ